MGVPDYNPAMGSLAKACKAVLGRGGLVGMLVLVGCERPAPPPTYELRLPFSVPSGTELAIDGTVVGTFDKQKVRFELPRGATPKGAKSLAVRFATVCGHADRPVVLSGDAVEELAPSGHDGKPRTIEGVLTMDPAVVPQWTTVWLDPEVVGKVTIGDKELSAGPSRVLLADCDEAGRTVTVAGERRGSLPADATQRREQLFIPASPGGCYAVREHLYEKGELQPKPVASTTLSGKPFYEVPLINFFLQGAPATIEVIQGSPTETKKALARVECDEAAVERDEQPAR